MGKLKEFFILNCMLPVSDMAFHTDIAKWYKVIKRMYKQPASAIMDWQNAKLQVLIKVAYEHSPYYHELFDSVGVKPEDVKTFADLEKLPPLTKETLRARFDDIKLTNISEYHSKLCSTGGSTGNPTRYIKDNVSWGFDNAFNILMWKQTGYHYGDKFLALGSSSIFPVNKKSRFHEWYYRIKGKVPFNAMNLSEDRLSECVELLKKKRIHYIYGYASSIFLLAKYVKQHNLGPALGIKACFPTSEILTDLYRSTIKDAFGCVISDTYGAHDGGIVAHSLGDGFKVSYNCIVEIDKNSRRPDGSGVAMLTDVTNLAFPFIRYELGDELVLGGGYDDSYNGQVLERVIGRTSDVIELENGRVLTGPGFTILFSQLKITGYRLYKSGPMEITVEVVKDSNYSKKDDELLVGTMKKHAGDDCEIKVVYADKVKHRENGKNLYFLNERV